MKKPEFSMDDIFEKYPDAEEFLVDLYRKYIEVTDALGELDEKFPVDGYEWDLDINQNYLMDNFRENPSIENTPWTLLSTSLREENDKKHRDRLQRQLACVNGDHEWKQISDHIKWCRYCGTICRDTYRKGKDEMLEIISEYIYPDCPHFLLYEEKGDQ